ncbi:solute carrier family 49 member 4 homolog [Physella acuta]|uniref:solute carrier family 49 member 4 homolog n=1 Tax=Physella acuta TaxID=109671 RepID=UPI0027DDCED2|nr:solute carrier family 49 member 4 homolog [Physella acuta]
MKESLVKGDLGGSLTGGDSKVKVYYVNECVSLDEVLPSTDKQKEANEGQKEETGVKTEIKVFKRRWYVLLIFSLYAMTQCAVWNTWGPIATTSKDAFGWSNATVAWMTNWGPISFVLCGFLFPWILQVKGLRWATLPSMLLVFLGTCCRVITSDSESATILIHIGQFLNGLAGPIAMGGFPTLSAAWFPPGQRVTATAIGVSLTFCGGALSFVLGPKLVSVGPPNTGNQSGHALLNVTGCSPADECEVFDVFNISSSNSTLAADRRVRLEKEEILKYMYYECGWAGLIMLALLLYFPSTPPQPPSVTATTSRDVYWPGLWSLRKNTHFLLLTSVYGVSTGVMACWGTVLNVILEPFGVSEDKAGWLGFYSTLASSTMCLLVGRFSDRFVHHMKVYILVLFVLGAGCFTLFLLMFYQVLGFTDAVLYSSVIGGQTLIYAAIPLMYEMGCELAYPTSEGAANGFLTIVNNIVGLLFLVVFAFPDVGTRWTSGAALGSVVVCIPMILLLKNNFNRLKVDEGLKPEDIQVTVEKNNVKACN